jgi:hypothetical protein
MQRTRTQIRPQVYMYSIVDFGKLYAYIIHKSDKPSSFIFSLSKYKIYTEHGCERAMSYLGNSQHTTEDSELAHEYVQYNYIIGARGKPIHIWGTRPLSLTQRVIWVIYHNSHYQPHVTRLLLTAQIPRFKVDNCYANCFRRIFNFAHF